MKIPTNGSSRHGVRSLPEKRPREGKEAAVATDYEQVTRHKGKKHKHHDESSDRATDAAETDEKSSNAGIVVLVAAGVTLLAAGAAGAVYMSNKRRMDRERRFFARAARFFGSPAVRALGSAIAGAALTAASAKAKAIVEERMLA